MENVTTWGTLGLEIVIGLVGLVMLTLRQGVSLALASWASHQNEAKDSVRILKLQSIVDSGLATVELNIFAELGKDLRAAMADGVLDAQERDDLRSKIAAYARTTLSTQGVEAAKEIYSISEDKLDDWLANRIESRVVTSAMADPSSKMLTLPAG